VKSRRARLASAARSRTPVSNSSAVPKVASTGRPSGLSIQQRNAQVCVCTDRVVELVNGVHRLCFPVEVGSTYLCFTSVGPDLCGAKATRDEGVGVGMGFILCT
jgi:hypothetical protein